MGDADLKVHGDVVEYLENLEGEIDKELVKAMLDAALHAEGELKETILETFPSGGTGALSRNPKATLLDVKGKIKTAGAFLDLVYADIQDVGGTVRPKSGRNLAIPISPEAKVPGKWPRHWSKDRLQLIPRKGKPPLLAEEVGKFRSIRGSRSGASEFKSKLKVHYVLKPSITIKGKGYVARARRAAEDGIREIMGRNVRVAISHTKMPEGAT